MMEFVTVLEKIDNGFDKIQALLASYAREYIDISDEEALYMSTGGMREEMTSVYSAIMELVAMYAANVSASIEHFHTKAKGGNV